MNKFLLVSLLIVCKVVVFSQAVATQPSATVANSTDTTTFVKVEFESEFPGGSQGWQQFLQQNLSYPRKAVKKNIQGTVILKFIVCTDGTVCDIQAVSGPDELRQSAVEAMKKTPRWKPAMQNNRNVKSYKTQPIVYRLE